MQEILLNLANIHLLQFCKEQGIDPSGSHVEKIGRGFAYNLISDETGNAFVGLIFHKNSRPTYTWFNEARKRGKDGQ